MPVVRPQAPAADALDRICPTPAMMRQANGRRGMETDLWTWGGAYFGYRDGDELWAHDGRLVGRFQGHEIFGSNGHYLGEIRDGDRLITYTAHLTKVTGAFSTNHRGGRSVHGARGARELPGGYQDFPTPEHVR
jgi:hypothetical protein